MDRQAKRERSEEYERYMNSDRWRDLRQVALGLARHRCANCGWQSECGMHVHHLTYERFGHELLSDLQVLCQPCHLDVHAKPKRAKKARPKIASGAWRKRRKKKWKKPKYDPNLGYYKRAHPKQPSKLVAENEALHERQQRSVRRQGSRATGTNPRALGTNPRTRRRSTDGR